MSIPCAVCGEPSDTPVHPECRELWVERQIQEEIQLQDAFDQRFEEPQDPYADYGDYA